MILTCAALYAFALFLIKSSLKDKSELEVRVPFYLPHGALVKGGTMTPLIMTAWALLFILAAAGLRFLDPETATSAEFIIVELELILIGSAMVCLNRIGDSSFDEAETENLENSLKEYNYIMVIGTAAEIIALKGVIEVGNALVETPYQDVMLAPSSILDSILSISPGVQVLPWTQEAHEIILQPYAEAMETLGKKIEETMNAEAGLEEEKARVISLKDRLSDTEKSVRTLTNTLQETRLKGNIPDYSRMTDSQREEERRNLEESMRRLQACVVQR